EHPELRKFAGNFLTDIARRRPELLRAALTAWRWGRQNKPKTKGAPLGGFEEWTAWIRDPLVALDCQDPIAQIAKAKAADPKRIARAETFHTWWEHHSGNKIFSSDLHYEVKVLLVPKTKEPSRQAVQSKVSKLVGTRLAGFVLCSDQDDKKKGEKGRWTPVLYWLERTKEAEAAEADDPDDWQFNHEPADAGGIPLMLTIAQK